MISFMVSFMDNIIFYETSAMLELSISKLDDGMRDSSLFDRTFLQLDGSHMLLGNRMLNSSFS